MSAPASRPVHPCVLNLTEGTRGCEFSTWAHITTRKPELPNLVTASASTLNIYSVDGDTGKLKLKYRFGNLAGSFIFLSTLKAPTASEADSLLAAFSGYPRLTVFHVHDSILQALSLVDLTQAISENSFGSTTVLDQDAVLTCLNNTPGAGTVACILGGGVAVAVISISYQKHFHGWMAEEPYILPLKQLSDYLPHHARDAPGAAGPINANNINANLGHSISTGFGDILSATFLSGYLEPVLVLLHTDPGGMTWCGRLGRISGGAIPAYVTALSVSVAHNRTAVLWCKEVPTDTFCITSCAQSGCLAISANSLTILETGGTIAQVIATNGFAEATCPLSMQPILEPNPVVKLAIQLDGSQISWVSKDAAVIVLRFGQIYVLQRTAGKWLVLSTGQTLGAIGEIANLSSVLFEDTISSNFSKIMGMKTAKMSLGFLFTGSRLGDSVLLGYSMEAASMPLESIGIVDAKAIVKKEIKKEITDEQVESGPASSNNLLNEDHDHILRLEEEALYVPSSSNIAPDVVPPSDEEGDEDQMQLSSIRKRSKTVTFTVVRTLTPLDSLINLGPLGGSCEGPLSNAAEFLTEKESSTSVVSADLIYGASAHIFPCGYASSGGVALVTIPGRDDRVIMTEEDCLNVECIFSLSITGIVLLGLSKKSGSGMRLLRLNETAKGDGSHELIEIDIDTWCSMEEETKIFRSALYCAGEFTGGCSVLLIGSEDDCQSYSLVILKEKGNRVEVTNQQEISYGGERLVRVSPFTPGKISDHVVISFACLWASGDVSVITLSIDGEISSSFVKGKSSANITETMDVDKDDEDPEEKALKNFYSDESISAVDVFKAPANTFINSPSSQNTFDGGNGDDKPAYENKANTDFDEEDEELYATGVKKEVDKNINFKLKSASKEMHQAEEKLFLGIFRKSGALDIYSIEERGTKLEKCWGAQSAAIGLHVLKSDANGSNNQDLPRSHMVSVVELRFFQCRPTIRKSTEEKSYANTICVAMETSASDVLLYQLCPGDNNQMSTYFQKIPMRSVFRPSQEQSRHHSKLLRKGMIGKDSADSDAQTFTFNSFHRFSGISGQDGIFAACARPFWIVSERGRPCILSHRSRHASPAGGKSRPVSGFCSGAVGSSGFLTLHERVGRVGSQRLTLFKSLSPVFESQGLLPGSGCCVEKIPMGVTVRKIKFINDDNASTGDHPLYAMIVSREVEMDQSAWNTDGLTAEERKRIEDEKEAAKIQRQVEADLGGFDMESEWVEEIEREDCFKVDTDLGGAPPLRQSAYSLWIVDAANKWMVVDSYELEEHEHGLDLQVMKLTEFREEPGSTNATMVAEEDSPKRLFITVGTAIVNHNGEDVSSKGRTLLFEIKRPSSDSRLATSQVAELSLTYEKEIFHGPVTTLSCLSSEGKNRIVIGAGSDVNIEQWGNGKLTQVGFFRATMQVLDILLFKNFFLLSDAYDSMYFLVWRESDKSLTLLAKDYDPIPVYAAGIMNRGAAMTFLCHDDRQNFQFFQYAPGEATARGGNKLICRADFHYGSTTTSFSTHYCRSSLLIHSATPASTLAALKQQDAFFGRQDDDNKLGIHFGTTDGCLGTVVPVSEPVYWRLMALQSVMSNALESDCALNRRSWRLYRRTPRRGGCRSNDRKKGVIDGDLVLQYADLSVTEQEDIASAIGSTVGLILDNLLELQCGSMMI